MGGPGLGGPGMGGPTTQTQAPKKLKAYNVWDTIERVLNADIGN
jgi:hypothetical protein